MLTFLYWNLNKKPLLPLITSLVNEQSVDILILAESDIREVDLLENINKDQQSFFFPSPGIQDRVKLYSRFTEQFVMPVSDRSGLLIRSFRPPLGKEFLVVAVHLPSKLYKRDRDQDYDCYDYAELIIEAEEREGHSRTIVIGDFNMNPFEHGIIAAGGFHAIMDRRIAQKVTRDVNEKPRKFFYNPMWNYFGDLRNGPPGTYYYEGGTQLRYYWNIFDQVLIRPDIAKCFKIEHIDVITRIGKTSLIKETGAPDTRVGSDHFPLLFKLDQLNL